MLECLQVLLTSLQSTNEMEAWMNTISLTVLFYFFCLRHGFSVQPWHLGTHRSGWPQIFVLKLFVEKDITKKRKFSNHQDTNLKTVPFDLGGNRAHWTRLSSCPCLRSRCACWLIAFLSFLSGRPCVFADSEMLRHFLPSRSQLLFIEWVIDFCTGTSFSSSLFKGGSAGVGITNSETLVNSFL